MNSEKTCVESRRLQRNAVTGASNRNLSGRTGVSRRDPRSQTRVAIVGCGPKGFYSLQSLCDQLRDKAISHHVSVTIFEPCTHPGAGNIYDPSQPACLRMNFASRFVDAWVRRGATQTTDDSKRLSLVQWLEQNAADQAAPDGFVSRGLVGHYLYDCFQQTLSTLPENMSVSIIAEHVHDLQQVPTGWKVSLQNSHAIFDEVLITTGHGGWRRSNLNQTIRRTQASLNIVEPVFPVSRQLNEQAVPANSRVAVRGFALTFIDAALALTEGRGGTFECCDGAWKYYCSGKEPATIFPFSRSGRPMFAKPDLGRVKVPETVNALWQSGRDAILEAPETDHGISFTDHIWPVVQRFAYEALKLSRDVNDTSVVDWFNEWSSTKPSIHAVIAAMRNSCDVSTGIALPDEAWALGESWRQLYPSIVTRVSHGGLCNREWPNFRRIACELERIAFGPPAENVGRLLALIDAGVVDLSELHSKNINADVIINAVIPSTGDHAPNSPLAKLLERGIISRQPGTGGIAVDGSGNALSIDNELAPGLAIIGRSTEGCVLGNDTLSRTLHDHPVQWARRVVQLIATTSESKK